MIRLRLVAGARAGQEQEVRQFPFSLGRSAEAGLQLDAPGVWERHCELERHPVHGIQLHPHAEALTLLNGNPVRKKTTLRNGDLLEVGEAHIQFWLSPAVQRGLRLRETLTWIGLASVVGLEIALICWLTR